MSPQRRGLPYRSRGGKGPAGKRAIVALVERGGGVRSFHVAVADRDTVQKIIADNIARETRLHTDESRLYPGVYECCGPRDRALIARRNMRAAT